MGSLRTEPVRVRVPATSANLGPGFDAFGLALGLDDVITAHACGDALRIEVAGEGAGAVPVTRDHLVVRSMDAAFARLGVPAPDGLVLRCENRIPHGRGLGSSSAAIVGGILAARALVPDGEQRLDTAAVFTLANELEGHPDNVAAAVHGGFTIAWSDAAGSHVLRLQPEPSLVAVVAVPAFEVATKAARGLLPATVPHTDAAANAGRAALLVEALTHRPDLLLAATEDHLHQSYRAPAMPQSAALVRALRAAGTAAVISGAGPTVLALVRRADADAVLASVPSTFGTSVLPLVDAGAGVLPA